MAGSIEDRGNGSWRLVVSTGLGPNGKYGKKQKTVKAKNITQARILLAEFRTEIEKGSYIAPSYMKFGDYVDVWKKEAAKRLAPSTIELYDYLLDGRVLSELSHIKMEDVTHHHLIEFMEILESEELSSSTIQKHHNLFNNIFKLAIKNDTIKVNPMDKVDPPKITYKEGQVYNSEELKQLYHLLNKEENTQMVLIIKLALLTGMRKGEILALQWHDIDFATNTIHVRHSMSYTKKSGYQMKEPKTKGSIRKVAPPEKFMIELKKHIFKKKTDRLEVSELWEGGKYFFAFSTDFGKPLFPSSPNQWWSRFHKRINKKLEENEQPILKEIRFHDLRHTAATDLINRGANPHSISKRLGHANIKTTMNIYGHYLEEADQKIADMLDEDYI